MKKKDIRDLIVAHYEGNDREFFRITLNILKELKKESDNKFLFCDINMILKTHVKISPKREIKQVEITSSEYDDLYDMVPMEDSSSENL